MATILVIDDNAGVRGLVQDALEALGHVAIPFADGVSAISWLQAPGNVPDLALLDRNLVGMSGAETAEALEIHAPGVPILFMTGEPPPGGSNSAMLIKPFGLAELDAAIGQVLIEDPSDVVDRDGPSRTLDPAVRAERARILRLLHDDFSQRLTGMRLVADLVENGVLDPRAAMDRIAPQLTAAVRSLRSLMDELSDRK